MIKASCKTCGKELANRYASFCRQHVVFSDERKQKMSDSTKQNVKEGKHNTYKDGRMKDGNYVSWLKNKRNRLQQSIPKEKQHTSQEWKYLKDAFGNMCACCKKPESDAKLTVDHIIPLSKGGSDLIENIQPLCQSCNSRKQDNSFNPPLL